DEGFDADGDGVTPGGATPDCDDGDASVSPGATEVPEDLVDNDCDSLVDEGDWSEGDLALTEFMMNPGRVADPHGEWFEVYNTTDRTLILNGLVFSSSIDGDEHVVDSPELLLLEPGDFFVFGNNADTRSNGGVDVGYEYTDIVLANESDELVIAAEGVVIDALTWDDGTLFPDPDGASIGTDMGIYDATTNDDPSLWCAATLAWNSVSDKGSPGTGNEYCSTYDHDGDGYNGAQGDCDDADDTTYPDAWEGTDPVDNDCDGAAETAPVAVVAASSTGYSCDGIELSSSGSYDIESMPLTYTWELTSAPAESALTSSDIETSTSANPTFIPDVAGTYVFTLTVNDGGTDSAPASVSVTVDERPTNAMPVADAGADQSSSLSSTCTSISYGTAWRCDDCSSTSFSLSAAGTTDPDGDEMTYEWTVLSGSTYGSLSASSGESVTLTVSGLDATYGSANDQLIEVEMAATDCMGATNRDR
ncbi:MAG: PKD domain-containing protein, partial [Myxococcota bacterium]